jgi:hypothetical protein
MIDERIRELGDWRGHYRTIYEPRRKRQPDALAILPDMRDACIHAKRSAALVLAGISHGTATIRVHKNKKGGHRRPELEDGLFTPLATL